MSDLIDLTTILQFGGGKGSINKPKPTPSADTLPALTDELVIELIKEAMKESDIPSQIKAVSALKTRPGYAGLSEKRRVGIDKLLKKLNHHLSVSPPESLSVAAPESSVAISSQSMFPQYSFNQDGIENDDDRQPFNQEDFENDDARQRFNPDNFKHDEFSSSSSASSSSSSSSSSSGFPILQPQPQSPHSVSFSLLSSSTTTPAHNFQVNDFVFYNDNVYYITHIDDFDGVKIYFLHSVSGSNTAKVFNTSDLIFINKPETSVGPSLTSYDSSASLQQQLFAAPSYDPPLSNLQENSSAKRIKTTPSSVSSSLHATAAIPSYDTQKVNSEIKKCFRIIRIAKIGDSYFRTIANFFARYSPVSDQEARIIEDAIYSDLIKDIRDYITSNEEKFRGYRGELELLATSILYNLVIFLFDIPADGSRPIWRIYRPDNFNSDTKPIYIVRNFNEALKHYQLLIPNGSCQINDHMKYDRSNPENIHHDYVDSVSTFSSAAREERQSHTHASHNKYNPTIQLRRDLHQQNLTMIQSLQRELEKKKRDNASKASITRLKTKIDILTDNLNIIRGDVYKKNNEIIIVTRVNNTAFEYYKFDMATREIKTISTYGSSANGTLSEYVLIGFIDTSQLDESTIIPIIMQIVKRHEPVKPSAQPGGYQFMHPIYFNHCF